MLACMTLSRLEADPLQDLRRDINDHFKTVGQRFAVVDRRFDQLEARLDGFGRRADVVVQRLDGVDRRLQRLEKLVGFVARQHGWTEQPPGLHPLSTSLRSTPAPGPGGRRFLSA